MAEKARFSNSMMKTYWRSQVNDIYHKNVLLNEITLKGNVLTLSTQDWDGCWGSVPYGHQENLFSLKKSWNKYIENRFDENYIAEYVESYFNLLSSIVKRIPHLDCIEEIFLAKLIGFENSVFSSPDSDIPFAAFTSNFRNPIFLSFRLHSIRLNERNDPSLLPIIISVKNNMSYAFYHYRKQRLLKNTDENILYFPAVDHHIRGKSFQGFDSLKNILTSSWDSRIEQRTKLIADKVLLPLLESKSINGSGPLRILDIGSGDCILTMKLISRLTKSGILNSRKIELSLLDIIKTADVKTFLNSPFAGLLSKVEYISSDYKSWLLSNNNSFQYDFVFLFRIIHNFSNFHILSEESNKKNNKTSAHRYRVFPHLSDYYQGISFLHKLNNRVNTSYVKSADIYYPARVFNDYCLMLNNTNLIKKLKMLSRLVLIEDSDLTSDVLLRHLSSHVDIPLSVYNFSKHLKLRTNSFFGVTENDFDIPEIGEKIWSKS